MATTLKAIEDNLIKLQNEYEKEFPGQRITKNEYEKRGGYTEDTYKNYGGLNFKKLMEKLFPEIKVSQDVKDRLLEKAFKFYEENKEDCPVCLSRDYFTKNSSITKHVIETTFGNYNQFIKVLKKKYEIEDEKENITRDDFNIIKDESNKKNKRKYFVTSAIAGAEISIPFLKSIKTYCKQNKAELIVLPMRGIHKKDIFLPHVLKEIENYICTKIKFNNNLQAKDFRVLPSMMKPLTGLARIGSKETSLIVASPKQQVETVAVSNRTLPHVLFTTGTLSVPDYADDRLGILGDQDNIVGGLIVEIRDEEIFHIRMVGSDNKGCFYDLDNYYTQNGVKKSKIEAFVMGDLHSGSEDEQAIKAWKDCIKLTKPKYVVMHDVMDNASINPHEKKNIVYSANLPEFAKTLESELNTLGNTLKKWTSEFSKTKFIVTKGNHDLWLTKYLQQGEYALKEQAHNHRFALSLAPYVLDEKNPIAEYINKKFNLKNITWLEVDDDFKVLKQQLGYHGHKGSNSGKSSAAGLELSQGMGIFGHTHTCSVLRGVMIVGTSTKLKLSYNKDGASSWTHSSALLYPSGHKTLIIVVEGNYKI
jgi:hypothetical protein